MPFQDYEIIQTKRVNKNRKGQFSIFGYRLWLASGSFSTFYLASLLTYAARLHTTHFDPSVLHMAPKPLVAPGAFLVGLLMGVNAFGDMRECKHLLRNYFTYRREFKMIKDELFYN